MIIVLNSDLFGRNVEYLRKQKHLSRRKLASMTGLVWWELFCIEKGTLLDVDHQVMMKICEILETEMEQIININLKIVL